MLEDVSFYKDMVDKFASKRGKGQSGVMTVGGHSDCPSFERGSAWAVVVARRRFMFDVPNA
jgi:hypothetical protein